VPARPVELSLAFDRLSLRVGYRHERELWQREEAAVRTWSFVADLAPVDGGPDRDRVRVAHGTALLVEVAGRNPFDALDEHSEAAMEIGDTVFDAVTGELGEDFARKVEGVGDRLLVLSEIEVEERWRGRGLGPVVAGLVIETLGAGALAAVGRPAPPPRPGVRSTPWAALGFRPHRDGVHYVDLAGTDFAGAFEVVLNRFTEAGEVLLPATEPEEPRGLRLVRSPEQGPGCA
jgi:hypothetical protein